MSRLPTTGELGGGNASNGGNLNWSAYRQPYLASSSAENSLREIRDSIGPYRNSAGIGYAARSMTSAQGFSASTSSTSSYMESSSSSSSFWTGQQLCHVSSPPNCFTMGAGMETSSTGQFMKPTDIPVSQSAKFRPGGVVHHQEALNRIKESLRPYSNSTADYVGNMDTLSSESSSGTTASGEMVLQNGQLSQESFLLDQLVQMGFERESALCALKLTQFRSLNQAVEVLLNLNMTHVFRDQDALSNLSRKPSFDNGENGARAESPISRIPTPQNRAYGTGISAMPTRSMSSGVSTSGAVYSIPVANQRTPSPMSKPHVTVGMSNYVTAAQPAHFINAAVAQFNGPASTSATPTNGAEGSGYFAMTGGPKRSHITVNLQSSPRSNARTTNATAADPMLIRERPIILQADKRQVEKPVAQSAISPTIISINNNSAAAAGQTKVGGGYDRQDGRQAPTKVLSARFDAPGPDTVRINVKPVNDSASGQCRRQYQLEANTTTGQVLSIQGRGECANMVPSTSVAAANVGFSDLYMESASYNQVLRTNQQFRGSPLSTATKLSSQRILLSPALDGGVTPNDPIIGRPDYSLALAHLQQQRQQQLQGYRHHIVVGENGPSENDDSIDHQQQQIRTQRLQLGQTAGFGHGLHSITNTSAQQNEETTDSTKRLTPETLSSTPTPQSSVGGPVPSFNPLPSARRTMGKAIDCFATVKEESISQQLPLGERSSPTGSASTEESENSASGGGTATNAATPSISEPTVRCESPLPDCVLQRYHHSNNEASQSPTNITGVASASACSTVKPCTPQAFKFFMEQHIENVIKQHIERQTRRMQLEKEMVKAKLTTQVQCQMRKLLNNKESNYLRMKRQKMNASTFEKLKTIGLGAFGEVALVRKKDTGALFAMKTLRKSDVIQKNQAAHVKAERDILSEADNEWVVKLFYSFQDKEHLFFIMEYIPGGDMMALLIKKGIFDEGLARFYVAELVCAIQSVHKLGFIHRDIKPDNILIDRNGHIKLTDFGLCTGLRWTHDWKYYTEAPKVAGHVYQDSFDMLQNRDPNADHKVLSYRQQKPRQKSHSLVGTPNYIAPEVLARSGHTQLCDWWSVGVILYEMVIGHPPFLANTPEETQAKVLNWRSTLQIPEEASLSPATTDLILQLCCGVEERLGREPNAVDILMHPFFQDIHWPTLRSSPAPYKPEILHAMDTSNFDPVEPRADLGPSTFGTDKMSKHDHAFYEFTFRRFFDSDGHGCPTLRSRPTYHHPSLETVLERTHSNATSPNGRGPDETSATASSSTNANLSNAYSRAPVYLNEQGRNILRISTDDRAGHPMTDAASNYQDFRNAEEEPTPAFSGPGRPRAEDSFSYDDPTQAQASDGDDETSDSAVYV